ncbi:MAG: N-acetylmuramoyl-L-alanine amidase family protein [Tepidiformaceae bacterium]
MRHPLRGTLAAMLWSLALLVLGGFVAGCGAADDALEPRESPHAALAADSTAMASPAATPPLEAGRSPPPASPTATPAADVAPRPLTVVIDPGHGGDDIGAARNGLVEKHSNLDMALRAEEALREKGYRVVLTRRGDKRATDTASAPAGFSANRLDLQARIDIANGESGDLFISIHSNSSSNGNERGIEVWYDPGRAHGTQNEALAKLLLAEVGGELRRNGFEAADRGLKDDTCFRVFDARCFPLFLLGPPRETRRDEVIRRGGDPAALGMAPGQNAIYSRASAMPGALVELLFVSNDADNATLQTEAARDAMARGIATAVERYFAEVAR